MLITRKEIDSMGKVKRLNLINSVTGIKPGNLIGSISKDGISNLAIFSSVVHLGSSPPLIGFVLRPSHEVKRDTWQNIEDTGVYTINHVAESFIEKAHYSSARFHEDVSEFDSLNMSEVFHHDFPAPFVGDSYLKIGMRFLERIPIQRNNTALIVGEIDRIELAPELIQENGMLDLSELNSVGIAGLNSYYKLSKLATFPYARVHELPDFKG